MKKATWREVNVGKVGKMVGDVAGAIPFMNLKEVDATKLWLRDSWDSLPASGRKLLWSRAKRREEELLGRPLGKPMSGGVRVMTSGEAEALDEVRRLRQRLRERGDNPD